MCVCVCIYIALTNFGYNGNLKRIYTYTNILYIKHMHTNLQIVLILHMEENQSLLRAELELVHLLHGTTRNLHLQF